MEYSDTINTLMQLRDDARSVAIANFMDNNPGVDWRTLPDSDFEEQIIKPTLGIFGVENEAKLQEIFKLESTPQKFENGGVVDSDVSDGENPKQKTKVFIAMESKPLPTYSINEDNIPKELRGYQQEFWKIEKNVNDLIATINRNDATNAEISAVHDKVKPLIIQLKELENKFDTSKYNPPKRDDFFKEQGDILETKLKEYYPDVEVEKKFVYKDNFKDFLGGIKKAKDSGYKYKTIFINHSDNHQDKAFGLREQDVYGDVAKLGSDIYCANCQDETQPEVLQRVTNNVNSYYPAFVPSKYEDYHRTWGGVNKNAKKGKDLDDTLQQILYTIHDAGAYYDYDPIYKIGDPLFRKTEKTPLPSKEIKEAERLKSLPIKPINRTQKFKRGGVVLPDPVLDLISRLKTNK